MAAGGTDPCTPGIDAIVAIRSCRDEPLSRPWLVPPFDPWLVLPPG